MADEVNTLFKSDQEGVSLRFYETAVKNQFLSEKLNRPIYDQVLMAEALSAQSRASQPHFEIERVYSNEALEYMKDDFPNKASLTKRTVHYARFAAQVKAFRENSEDGPNRDQRGTPLSGWPPMDKAILQQCKDAHIYTVEQVAALPDDRVRLLGPDGAAMREQAKAYLKTATDGAAAASYAIENQHLRDDNERLKKSVADLAQAVQRLNARLEHQGVMGGLAQAQPPVDAFRTSLGSISAATVVPETPTSPLATDIAHDVDVQNDNDAQQAPQSTVPLV